MKVFIAGSRGMVGSALVRRFSRVPGTQVLAPDRSQLDLLSRAAVDAFFAAERPQVAIIAAGKVGGIEANRTFPAEFLQVNLAIASHTIDSAYRHHVERLLFLGSSCIYPKHAPQPIQEASLLTGPLEPTNEAYAIAKIAGLKLAQYYRQQFGVRFHSAMPTNLYGPNDNYRAPNSHVLPALIRRFHEAKIGGQAEVIAWGTGTARREFLHVDDLAQACLFLTTVPDPPDWVNVGTGTDITIRELTETVAEVVGFTRRIAWDATKPDGTPRKVLDVSRLAALGWTASIPVREGIRRTYADFLAETARGSLRI